MPEYESPPSDLKPGSIVDAYLRDSGGSKQDRSVPRQLEALQIFCKQHGLVLRHTYKDAAKSGKTVAGRDDFNRMVSELEVQPNRPSALLIWNYARFARDVDDSQLYKALIRKWGVIIHSLTDQVPEGRFQRVIETLIETSNQEKREQTARDAADGLRSIVQQGALPGTPPRGFKREPIITTNYRSGEQRTNHRWVPDPDWIPRVQKAFTMRAAGLPLQQINAETHIYDSMNSYRTFFSNPLYIGELNFGSLVIEHYCDPMVDRRTWDAVQAILDYHARRQNVSTSERHPRRFAATYLLSGLVHCARCKSPLYGYTSGQADGRYYYRYACTRAQRRHDCDLKPIPARQLEKNVVESLREFVGHPDNLAEFLELSREQTQEQVTRQQSEAKDLQKQINVLRRSITNVTNAIAEAGHSKAMLVKLSNLEIQETELQSRLLQLKEHAPEPEPPLTRQQILVLADKLDKSLASKEPPIVRSALLAVTQDVTVDRRGNHAYGLVTYYHRPRPKQAKSPPEDDLLALTASLVTPSMGAHF